MLAKGSQVGNYIVESHLGGGGMAQLYRVRHAVLGTLHALKVLNSSFREMAAVRGRFLTEGMIAAKLNHPNVVKVTDTVSTAEVAGLVMELVMGPNLEQYIRKRKSSPTSEQIREIFLPLLSAVGAAHQRGIIHRDIKPANILLEERAGRWIPKITDFGIAKVVSDNSNLVRNKSATQADARMGTLSYMSPEQIRGATMVTAESDIFSLGATLYELATCEVAFEGHSDYEVMHRIVEGQQTKPELLARIDPLIAAAIKRSLQPHPEQRFRTCEEFAAALGGGLDPELPAPLGSEMPRPEPLAEARSLRSSTAPEVSGSLAGSQTQPCPYCQELIVAGAKKCKHCFEYLDPAIRDRKKSSALDQASLQRTAHAHAIIPWQGIRPALFSLIVPGLGQFVAHQNRSALVWFGAAVFWYLTLGFPSALLIHGAAALHAYKRSSAARAG